MKEVAQTQMVDYGVRMRKERDAHRLALFLMREERDAVQRRIDVALASLNNIAETSNGGTTWGKVGEQIDEVIAGLMDD